MMYNISILLYWFIFVLLFMQINCYCYCKMPHVSDVAHMCLILKWLISIKFILKLILKRFSILILCTYRNVCVQTNWNCNRNDFKNWYWNYLFAFARIFWTVYCIRMHAKCTILRQKIQKFSDSPLTTPLGGGHSLPKPHPLCSNIVDDKTVTEMM